MPPVHPSRRRFLAGAAAASAAALLASLGCWPRRGSHHSLPTDLALLDILDASNALRARSLSPVDLTRACLERIERLDARLNSFITVTAELALVEARAAENEIAKGHWRGPLHGIPIGLKDNIDTANVRTTAASRLFADRVPAEDAEVVQRLEDAGAIILGKQNMHEFANGTTSAISHFGPVHNPWDLERVAGGSSGGSGAAVAARLCFGAVGTDTGGSIRIPAACCGIVGLKPTFGVISTRGTIPISTSFDHVGPMCRTVADTALMFAAMTDHPVAREYDPDSSASVSSLRVGVLRGEPPLCEGAVETEVQAAFDAALDVIRSLVSEVRETELPMPDVGRIIDAEMYAYHAPHLAATPQLYIPRERDSILSGKEIPGDELERMREELARHRAAIRESFSGVDVLVLPTLPSLPIRIRDAADPFAMNACTFAFSLGGLPSMSIPCGFSKSGLPIGLLLSGPPFSEPQLFALAQAYESSTQWHSRRPPES